MTTNVGSTGEPGPKTDGDQALSTDKAVIKLILDEWAEGQQKSAISLKEVEDLNNELSDVNDLSALIGKLLAEVTQSGDSKKLKEALKKDPGMLERINKLVKEVGISPPLFSGGVSFPPDADIPADILNAKPTDVDSLNRLVSIQVLKDFAKEDPAAFKFLFENKVGFDFKKLGKSNDKDEDRIQAITDQQWDLLVGGLFVKQKSGATTMDPPAYWVDPAWKDTPVGSMTWVVSKTSKLHQRQVELFNKVHAQNLSGSLTESHGGPDLYGAQEKLRSRQTSLSNTLQAKNSEASQTVQINEGTLKIIMNLMNDFTESKKRAFS